MLQCPKRLDQIQGHSEASLGTHGGCWQHSDLCRSSVWETCPGLAPVPNSCSFGCHCTARDKTTHQVREYVQWCVIVMMRGANTVKSAYKELTGTIKMSSL